MTGISGQGAVGGMRFFRNFLIGDLDGDDLPVLGDLHIPDFPGRLIPLFWRQLTQPVSSETKSVKDKLSRSGGDTSGYLVAFGIVQRKFHTGNPFAGIAIFFENGHRSLDRAVDKSETRPVFDIDLLAVFGDGKVVIPIVFEKAPDPGFLM